MYDLNVQSVDEHMINVHCYHYYMLPSVNSYFVSYRNGVMISGKPKPGRHPT